MTSAAVAGAAVLVCSGIVILDWRFPDGMTLWRAPRNVSCPARRRSGHGYADRSDYAFGPGRAVSAS
jgi:hypothetical protein